MVAYGDGHLLFQREGTLMAQPFDERTGRLIGEAVPTIENIPAQPRGLAPFSIAASGTLAYRAASDSAATLAWFDRQGARVGTVGGAGLYENPRLSPDGRWLAVCRRDRGQHDIWVVDLERNVPTRLTSDPAVDDFPVWSADGKHVIFASDRRGSFDLYWRAADGSGTDDLLYASPEMKRATDVSVDGTLLFGVRTGAGANTLDIWALRLAGDRNPFPVIASPQSNEFNGVFSPNGRWIAYQGRGGSPGMQQVYIQPFPSTGRRVLVSTSTGGFPQWSGDGTQIFYSTLDSLAAVDVSANGRPGVPRALFRWPWFDRWTVDRAGQRFPRPVTSAADSEEPITVVVNWTSTLRKK